MNKPTTSSDTSLTCPGLLLLHVDSDCVVVQKPAGLHSVPGLGQDKTDSVLTRLQAQDPNIFAVHRLDRDTSGVMVYGRHSAARRALGIQFQERRIHKRYVALVAGVVGEDAGTMSWPMRYDPDNKPRQVVDYETGKPAQTHWKCLQRRDDTSLISLEPITGRTHQLRLHLCTLGHAIIGDQLYASNQWQARSPRLCLHACELGFAHPSDGRAMFFEIPEQFLSI
ncbi:RluA family pseudouridine synthase [Paraperlucidibaca sp.]|jgi:tRNA pseudouridine32 synthase/23S rRNA pseudouridine746 synthase|uniref:RluA family pseudouridine synthase n=1 Tax=Paraperlucidibaca sp. TaxID=2708021 RepID=UPI003988C4FD